MPGPRRIFISYAHKDGAELALRLQRDLSTKGYDTWLDSARIDGGAIWSVAIEGALDRSDVVLALLSKGSFGSDICRGEQLRSLRKGKCVIPVLVQSTAERPVYLEARQYRDFSDLGAYEEMFRQLLRDIGSRDSAKVVERYSETNYEAVPPLPLNYVERPEALCALRSLVLGDGFPRHVGVTGVRGMGGVGKTILAQAICRDEMIQAAFPDGVAWVRIGQESGNLVAQMRDIAKALAESCAGFDTPENSIMRLRAMLREKAALIVLDDVWHASHVDMFRAEAPRCRMLFTTRDARIAATLGATEHCVELLTVPQARQLLAHYAGSAVEHLPPEADALVEQCGRLPLALAMTGAMVRDKPWRWANILHKLGNAALDQIQGQLPQYPFGDLAMTILASIESLEPLLQRRYYDLAVFPDDVAAPLAALKLLWRCDRYVAEDTVAQFVDASLATLDAQKRLTLHDLQRDFVRQHNGHSGLMALHERVIEAYSTQLADNWATGPNDGYFFGYLLYHLREAGRVNESGALSCNIAWMMAKGLANGIGDVLADLRSYAVEHQTGSQIGILGMALARAIEPNTQILSRLPRLLPQYVYNHLVSTSSSEQASNLLRECSEQLTGIWARRRARRPAQLHAFPVAELLITNLHVDSLTMHAGGRYLGVVGMEDYRQPRFILWDYYAHRTIFDQTFEPPFTAVGAFSLSGHLLAIGTSDGRTCFINVSAPDQRQYVRVPADVKGLAFDTYDRLTAIVSNEKRYRMIVLTPDGLGTLNCDVAAVGSHDNPKWFVSIGTHGDRIVGRRTTAWLFSQTGLLSRIVGKPWSDNTSIGTSPDGRTLLMWEWDGTVGIWDLTAGTERTTRLKSPMESWNFGATTGAVLNDRSAVYVGNESGFVVCWHPESAQVVETGIHHGRRLSAMTVNSEGTRLATAGGDGLVRVWDLATSRQPSSPDRHGGQVTVASISPDRQLVATGSEDSAVKIWDCSNGQFVKTLGHLEFIAKSVGWSNDGKLVVAASAALVWLWELESGRLLYRKQGHGSPIGCDIQVQMMPNGNVIAAVHHRLFIWGAGGDVVAANEVPNALGIKSIGLIVGEPTFVTGGYDGYVRTWTTDSCRPVSSFPMSRKGIYAVAVSTCGTYVCVGGDSWVGVWHRPRNVKTGEFRDKAIGEVTSLEFISNDRLVAVGTKTGFVWVFDTSALEVVTIVACDGVPLTTSWDAVRNELIVVDDGGPTRAPNVAEFEITDYRPPH